MCRNHTVCSTDATDTQTDPIVLAAESGQGRTGDIGNRTSYCSNLGHSNVVSYDQGGKYQAGR